MGKRTKFKKVNLFTGIIFNNKDELCEVESKLEEKFSKIDFSSGIYKFDFTSYYSQEMGSLLYRKFVSFTDLISPTELPDIKIFSNEIELIFSSNGMRKTNIDPGYISDANVIIATTKNHYHRIPLTKGIYAHMEYVFKNKGIHFLDWTYPDFKSEDYIKFFLKLSELYKIKIKN